MVDILSLLEDTARVKAPNYSDEVVILRGIWRCDYILKLSPQESVFNLHYVLAQTVGIGCSYYDPSAESPFMHESLLGRNILELDFNCRALRVATLDAVYRSLKASPAESIVIDGTNIKKAQKRAEIICNEVFSLLATRAPKRSTFKVLNVGVVGSILSILVSHKALGLHPELDINVTASDLYEPVVGTQVHGVSVEHGTYGFARPREAEIPLGMRTLELISEADVAIVTGMTLTNGTLNGILETAAHNKTSLLVFAETGAHFASEYCKFGVDVVVSEPFPFYLTCDGPTQIDIYRRLDTETQQSV
jgi:hypothetical protein